MDPQPQVCVLCKQANLVLAETYQGFTLWLCKSCEGRFWWPFKNPGAEWYEQDVRYHGRNHDPLLTPVDSHLLFLQDGPCPGGSLLDVGCGTGNFLAAAQKAGYQVHGTDFDRDAIQTAKDIFRLENVRVADIHELAKEERRYDVVTFFEVLEHLDEPSEFINLTRSLLKPNGWIALSVPDAASWDVIKVHDKPPRHLTRWSKEAMNRFLEVHGFEVQRVVQKRIKLSFLITKFHFWTKSFLSFDLVNKVQKKEVAAGQTLAQRVQNPRIRLLKSLARWKGRILFTIPASIVWIYLFVTRQTSTGLYVLAKRVEK